FRLYCRQSLYPRIRSLPHRPISLRIVLACIPSSVGQSSLSLPIANPYEAIAVSKLLRLFYKSVNLAVFLKEIVKELRGFVGRYTQRLRQSVFACAIHRHKQYDLHFLTLARIIAVRQLVALLGRLAEELGSKRGVSVHALGKCF